MGIRINDTVSSLLAQRQVDQAADRSARGIERLASGLRINRAADDAAGLAIAEQFRTAVRQRNQEAANFQAGVNLVQTAEAGLAEQDDLVLRLSALAIQASNGILTPEQRAAINVEAQQLINQFDTTAQNTEFNGQQVLANDRTITLDAEGDVQLTLNESTAASRGVADIDLSTQAGAQSAVAALNTAAAGINRDRAELGAQESRIETAIEQRTFAAQNLADAESRIRDLDVALGVIDDARNQLQSRTGLAAIVRGNVRSEVAQRLLGG